MAEAPRRLLGIAAGVGLRSLTAAPEHVSCCAEFDAELDRRHRLLQGEGAHLRVVRRKGTILKNRLAEEVCRSHGHNHTVVVERLLEVAHNRIALGCTTSKWDEVLVVQVDTPRATLTQLSH